jgi:hypothetical protein
MAQPQVQRPVGSSQTQAERDRQARLEFEQGRKAYDEGDYRGAWSSFHNAYRLSGRAQLLYNIGQAADRLGHDEDALTAFRMYLDKLPNADNRREVENRLRALEERVARAKGGPATGGTPPTDEVAPDSLAIQELPPTAAGADVPPDPPPLAAPEPRPTRRGIYVRVGLGLGYRRDGLSGNSDATVSGVGFAGELAVATSLWNGFVLGGAIYSDLASGPTVEANGMSAKLGSAHLTMFGPMVDWYLRPTEDGLHVSAALTFAVLSLDYTAESGQVALGRDASGVGAVLAAGYEWPIAQEWAVGVLGRLTLASLSDEMRSHGVFAPSLLASLTWY